MNEVKNDLEIRRVLLIGDTTLDPLGRMLERGQETPQLRASAAPYGQIFQILLDGSHPAWSPQPDILVALGRTPGTSRSRVLRLPLRRKGA